ncbi:MAG: hypothetical protein ACRD3M_04255, partial [Thermoanaerobaculia bacterium]
MDAGRRVRVTQENLLGAATAAPEGASAAETGAARGATRPSDGIRLAVAAEGAQRLERALAVSRAGLGGLLLLVELAGVAFWARGLWPPVVLLVVYALQGLAVWAWLRRHDSTPDLRRALHVLDVLWAAVLSIAGDDLLMLVSVLVIYAAAARWTRIEAIATAAVVS